MANATIFAAVITIVSGDIHGKSSSDGATVAADRLLG
jgi:hypothetical protein